jgi:hypothetical protein
MIRWLIPIRESTANSDYQNYNFSSARILPCTGEYTFGSTTYHQEKFSWACLDKRLWFAAQVVSSAAA